MSYYWSDDCEFSDDIYESVSDVNKLYELCLNQKILNAIKK